MLSIRNISDPPGNSLLYLGWTRRARRERQSNSVCKVSFLRKKKRGRLKGGDDPSMQNSNTLQTRAPVSKQRPAQFLQCRRPSYPSVWAHNPQAKEQRHVRPLPPFLRGLLRGVCGGGGSLSSGQKHLIPPSSTSSGGGERECSDGGRGAFRKFA